nr:MAG TPA: hypothetical protein [Caudoviricetes sp.]
MTLADGCLRPYAGIFNDCSRNNYQYNQLLTTWHKSCIA